MSEQEIWKPIPETGGWYDVSTQGRVRSWRKARGTREDPIPTEVSVSKDGGYYHARLKRADGRAFTRRAHQLVAEAFLGPRPGKQIIRHLNDDPSDNRVENLAYGTRRDNWLDAKRNGRPHGCIYTDDQVRQIRACTTHREALEALDFTTTINSVMSVRRRHSYDWVE